MTITDAEFADAGARIESHYLTYPALYVERTTRIDHLGMARWPTDYFTLRAAGQPHESAIRTVERRMAAAAGTRDPWPSILEPVTVSGQALLRPNGERYRWLGMTAFALPAMLHEGRAAEARAWMETGIALGYRLFRVLSMCDWLRLSSADGLRIMPYMLELARVLGVSLEVVGLSDTRSFGYSLNKCRAHLESLAGILAGMPGVFAQVANEHYHGTHIEELHDPLLVESLGEPFTRAGVIWTASPATSDEAPTPAGAYITRHLDRGRDPWNMVRRVRELENVSATTGRFVVNDEMIGAGEHDEPGRRLADPSIFYAAGVLGRIFEVGSTFHSEAGLRCDPFGPVQFACAQMFALGATIRPDAEVLRFHNAAFGSAGWPLSPVASYDTAAAVRVYSGVTDAGTGITAILGRTGDPRIQWANGWRPDGLPLCQADGFEVLRIVRS
jgi:hypothetical protein